MPEFHVLGSPPALAVLSTEVIPGSPPSVILLDMGYASASSVSLFAKSVPSTIVAPVNFPLSSNVGVVSAPNFPPAFSPIVIVIVTLWSFAYLSHCARPASVERRAFFHFW